MDRLTKLFVLLNLLVAIAGLALTDVISWTLFFGILLFVLLGYLAFSMFSLGRRIARTRCPRCGQFFANKPVRSTTMGIFNKYSASIGGPQAGDEDFGSSETVPNLISSPYVKLKVRYRCERCGFEWDVTKAEKLS